MTLCLTLTQVFGSDPPLRKVPGDSLVSGTLGSGGWFSAVWLLRQPLFILLTLISP